MTMNLWARHGNWPVRRGALQAGLRQLRPDVLMLQEAVVDDTYDQANDLLGDGYQIVHQRVGLVGDGRHRGASVASRWPIGRVHEVDLHLTSRTGDYSCGAVIVEVAAPPPLGQVLVVGHGPSWSVRSEVERELQAVAVVRRIEELVTDQSVHVVVGGDFNAEPVASSVRFWTGRKSLDGTSTAYRDCWESARGGEPGWTIDPDNSLTRHEERDVNRGRRIDYLLVRCHDHGPTMRITDCRLALDQSVAGVMASDHYGVIADLQVHTAN
jgi:endonuclease/exonuclease/phosphatase family metal-dependent hydrolase